MSFKEGDIVKYIKICEDHRSSFLELGNLYTINRIARGAIHSVQLRPILTSQDNVGLGWWVKEECVTMPKDLPKHYIVCEKVKQLDKKFESKMKIKNVKPGQAIEISIDEWIAFNTRGEALDANYTVSI